MMMEEGGQVGRPRLGDDATRILVEKAVEHDPIKPGQLLEGGGRPLEQHGQVGGSLEAGDGGIDPAERASLAPGASVIPASSSISTRSPATRCAVTEKRSETPSTGTAATALPGPIGMSATICATSRPSSVSSGRPSHAAASRSSIGPAPAMTVNVGASTTSNSPCGWIAPGIWIGSRSQAVISWLGSVTMGRVAIRVGILSIRHMPGFPRGCKHMGAAIDPILEHPSRRRNEDCAFG